jgi:hypothetical protein
MDGRGPGTIRGTYRSLLLRGLEPGEAANVTGRLHGLPSAGIRWTLAEVEAIVRRRAAHARSIENAEPTGLDPASLSVASPLPWSNS